MKNSPLSQKHIALSAKMADFGGWLMPIEYQGSGVLAEHNAVRNSVGLFDVSHLGKASVKGKQALSFLNQQFTNDLTRISDGQAQYTLLCNENGGVIDDLIVYRNSEEDFFLVPNAANTSDVVASISQKAPAGVEIRNLHQEFAVLALQGPRSLQLLESIGLTAKMDYMSFAKIDIAGCEVILCRTGYTGEYGFEIIPKWSDAEKIWELLAASLESFDGLVCGLGARDTLRTEMGYPLHGHELSLEITPVQASATWAIGWSKESFTGSQVLRKEKADGVTRSLRALLSTDRGIPRAGMLVKNDKGDVVGEVTSGTFSPTLKKGIALALISPTYVVGDRVVIDVRGRESVCEVVKAPFVPSHVR